VAVPGDDRTRWSEALGRLFPVPEPHRDETVDRADALDVLRCPEPILDELIAAGLPCSGERAEERFDPHDLFNLALYSRSGTSLAERTFKFALRWMGARTETLLERRLSRFSIRLSAARAGGCEADSSWALARPQPERFGGRVVELAVQPSHARLEPDWILADGTDYLRVEATVETVGTRRALESPVLRGIVDEFLDLGLRWVKVPQPVHHDPELLLANGVATCAAASLHLERRCRAAGFEVHTRRGWVIGMLDLVHAWLEVIDEDGRTKLLDPLFALLSDFTGAPNPDFAELCWGSTLNRLLPTAIPAGETLERHSCAGREATPVRETAILPAGSPALVGS
jgi:hypothetical protein